MLYSTCGGKNFKESKILKLIQGGTKKGQLP